MGPGPILWGRSGPAFRRAAASEPRSRTCQFSPNPEGCGHAAHAANTRVFHRRSRGIHSRTAAPWGLAPREPTPRPRSESGGGRGGGAESRCRGREMDRRRLAAGGGRARSPFSTTAADSSAPDTWLRAPRTEPTGGGTGIRAGLRATRRQRPSVCPSPVPRSGARPDSAERGRSRSRRPRGAERCHARAGTELRFPVPLLARGGGGLGGTPPPGPGGDTRGAEPRYISAAPPRAAHSGAGHGWNGGTSGGTGAEQDGERGARGGGGDRAAAPGRKESGEGGGVNIEYLLIAVEGRSVITGPSSPGGGRRGRCMQRWCRDPRPRAPSDVRGAAGGGRGGALAYRWP